MMITKNMRFKRWPNTEATSQQSFMDTADMVGDYLKKVRSPQIRQDVENPTNTPDYSIIYERPRFRRGVHLYCILDIEEAIDLLSTRQEKSILIALKNDLAALFDNFEDQPAQRVDNILGNFEAFFKIKATDFSDRAKAKELHYSFYLMLCIINDGLMHLSSVFRVLASCRYGVKPDKIQKIVTALLMRAEEKIMTIDTVDEQEKQIDVEQPIIVELSLNNELHEEDSSPDMRQEQDLDGVPPELIEEPKNNELNLEPNMPIAEQTLTQLQQFIQRSFDSRYSTLILSGISVQYKLGGLLELSKVIVSGIERLNAERMKAQAVLDQKVTIRALLQAVIDNDTYLVGRLYFTELKQRHAEAYNLLMELSSGSTKEALLANIESQEQNANSKTNKGLYALSTAFSPLTMLSRAFLSKQTQQYIASWSPETADAQAKKLVKQLTFEVLDDLEVKEQTILDEQQKLQAGLANGDTVLENLIVAESSESLAQIADLNKVQNNYDTLVTSLNVKEIQAVSVKTLIQDAFQQRYTDLMQDVDDEKAKVNSLISSMRELVKELNVLIELQTTKEALLLRINPLEALFDVVNVENKWLGAVINRPLKEWRVELYAIDKQVHVSVSKLSQGNHVLEGYLLHSSLDDLWELARINTVSATIDSKLLSIVPPTVVIEPIVPGEKTVQDYFNERTLSLLNHDSYEEEWRLAHVIKCMDDIDKNIEMMLAVREKNQAIAAKEQQMHAVVEVLESDNTSALLLNFTKERLACLSKEALLLQSKVDTAARNLAAGHVPLKQLVSKESSKTLLAVIAANKATRECIEHYKYLKDSISLLNDMKRGTSVLDSYTAENNTWWVRLTNFLARLCSLFKSQTGKMVDKANALKSDLLLCRQQCEQEIAVSMAKVKQDSNLGNDLLSDLPEQYHNAAVSEVPTGPFEPNKALGLLSEVSMFNPKHKIRETSRHFNFGGEPEACEVERAVYYYS